MPVNIHEIGPQPEPTPPPPEAAHDPAADAERVLRMVALRREREARLAAP